MTLRRWSGMRKERKRVVGGRGRGKEEEKERKKERKKEKCERGKGAKEERIRVVL